MHALSGRNRGLGLALLSAVAFGGSGVAAKPLIEAGLDPLQVVWMRVAGASLVLLPLAWRHRSLLRLRPGLVIGFGTLGVAGCQAPYFVAVSRIPVGVAILVEYLGPALLLGWIRFVQRRPVTRAAALGVLLALGGMACVVQIWSGLAFDALGLLCAFGAAFCQVAYFVLADHGADQTDAPNPAAVIAHGLIVGTVVLTALARPWDIPVATLAHRVELGGREVPAEALIGWIILVATVVAYLSGVAAVRRLSPQVAGVVACLEAVVAAVLAWVLLGEHLGAVQLAGGTLVLCGAFIAQTSASRSPRATESVPVAGSLVETPGPASALGPATPPGPGTMPSPGPPPGAGTAPGAPREPAGTA